MDVRFHRKFKKALKKQPVHIQKKFMDALDLFTEDPFHVSLNNHALTGKLTRTRSVDITGDVRVHYEEYEDVVVLVDIGTHSQLY